MVIRGFKLPAIAFVTDTLRRHGYINQEAYSAEKIRARNRDWWVREADLNKVSCLICGHSVDVMDIAVATRRVRTSYTKRVYWIMHEHCIKAWAAKHPIKSASVKKP